MIATQTNLQNYVRNAPSAIVYRQDASNSCFWRTHSDLLPNSSASVFWTRERQFTQLTEATYKAGAFEKGWDGYDSPSPNTVAIGLTLDILSRLRDSALNPYSVLPSADGGIGISFRGREDKRAVLEMFNDGTAAYMLYGKGHRTVSATFDLTSEWAKILQRLVEYL